MSQGPITRASKTSPIGKKDPFYSLLEPSQTYSPINTYSARTQSPTSKSFKSHYSPSPVLFTSKLEFTEKQNVLLQERNKVLSKEKIRLQKQLSKEKQSPANTFSKHAKILTTKNYLERLKKTQTCPSLLEKIAHLKKLVFWMNEQPIEREIKFIKPSIEEILGTLKGIEVEFEANFASIQELHTEKIQKLEEENKELQTKVEQSCQDSVVVLMKINSELVRENCVLTQKNEGLQKISEDLLKNNEKLQRPEIQEEMREKLIEEIRVEVFLEQKKQDKEVARSLLDLEERYLAMKKYSETLKEELFEKCALIQNLYEDIAQLKGRCIINNEKNFSNQSVFFDKKPRNWNKENLNFEFLSITTCLAAALEDFLL